MIGVVDYPSSDEEGPVPLQVQKPAEIVSSISEGIENDRPDFSETVKDTAAAISSTARATTVMARDYLSELPPVRNEGVSAETLARLGQYLEAQQQHNFDLTESIQRKKDFGNPHILTKVVDFFHIDELGSNYPPEIFDPAAIKRRNDPPTSNQDPAPTPAASGEPISSRITFVPATVQSDGATRPIAGEERKRKSRWG